jgi:hypothetical protein
MLNIVSLFVFARRFRPQRRPHRRPNRARATAGWRQSQPTMSVVITHVRGVSRTAITARKEQSEGIKIKFDRAAPIKCLATPPNGRLTTIDASVHA